MTKAVTQRPVGKSMTSKMCKFLLEMGDYKCMDGKEEYQKDKKEKYGAREKLIIKETVGER